MTAECTRPNIPGRITRPCPATRERHLASVVLRVAVMVSLLLVAWFRWRIGSLPCFAHSLLLASAVLVRVVHYINRDRSLCANSARLPWFYCAQVGGGAKFWWQGSRRPRWQAFLCETNFP